MRDHLLVRSKKRIRQNVNYDNRSINNRNTYRILFRAKDWLGNSNFTNNTYKNTIMTTDTLIIGTLIVVFLGLMITLIKIQL